MVASGTAPRGETVNIAGLCSLFGIARKVADDWIRRGLPVVQRGGRGKAWEIDTRAAIDWHVAEQVRLRPPPRPEGAPVPGPEHLAGLGLSLEQLDLGNPENLVPLKQYRAEHEIDDDEWAGLCVFGFPAHLRATESGGVETVVDRARADLWRLYFATFAELAGGNGLRRPGASLLEARQEAIEALS